MKMVQVLKLFGHSKLKLWVPDFDMTMHASCTVVSIDDGIAHRLISCPGVVMW